MTQAIAIVERGEPAKRGAADTFVRRTGLVNVRSVLDESLYVCTPAVPRRVKRWPETRLSAGSARASISLSSSAKHSADAALRTLHRSTSAPPPCPRPGDELLPVSLRCDTYTISPTVLRGAGGNVSGGDDAIGPAESSAESPAEASHARPSDQGSSSLHPREGWVAPLTRVIEGPLCTWPCWGLSRGAERCSASSDAR